MKTRLFLVMLIACFFACKKEVLIEDDPALHQADRQNIRQRAYYPVNDDNDTVPLAIQLGAQLPNPYLIPNMAQAYHNVTGQSSTPVVTNLYVRFLPSDFIKMHYLDSIAAQQNVELFDYPLDYEVLSEGEYYHDPSLNADQITRQYAVVAPNFSFPSNITYQVLASIHITTNVLVEQEAERLAGLNADGDGLASILEVRAALDDNAKNNNGKGKKKPVTTATPECLPGYHWDALAGQCVENNCPEGYTWNSNTNSCEPLPPAPDPVAIPAGRITVFDTNFGDNLPVRNVRMIAQRWFKIDRTFTNANGNFTFGKSFRRKVKVKVKFENDFCTIRPVFAVSALQSYFPVQKVIGKFSNNDIPNIDYTFGKTTLRYSNKLRRWAAATVFNAVQEHHDYAGQLGFNAAPQDMNIYISAYFNSGGSTPLFHQRLISAPPPVSWMGYFVASSNSLFDAFSAVANVDMLLGFGDYENLDFQSDDLKETTYHEMSHASHYSRAGSNFYNELVAAEIHEINRYAIFNTEFRPYGDGNDAASPIIALGEGWAYFMGHFLADRRYGDKASCTAEQKNAAGYGIFYGINCGIYGIASTKPHIDVLEFFDPNLQSDPFRWIPQGVFEDMIDVTNEIWPNTGPVNDAVSGYTIPMMINALESNVKLPQQFRDRVIQQTGTNQALIDLFNEYNYN